MIVTEPAERIVNVRPETVAMASSELLYDMGRPELDVADKVKGALPKVLVGKGLKVIV